MESLVAYILLIAIVVWVVRVSQSIRSLKQSVQQLEQRLNAKKEKK